MSGKTKTVISSLAIILAFGAVFALIASAEWTIKNV